MERVIVTRQMLGICHMQVCAVKDATTQEILTVCNRENPSGTEKGWIRVIREDNCDLKPVPCRDYADRFHYIVEC